MILNGIIKLLTHLTIVTKEWLMQEFLEHFLGLEQVQRKVLLCGKQIIVDFFPSCAALNS